MSLHRTLARLLLTPMMEPATPVGGAVVLLIAGVYPADAAETRLVCTPADRRLRFLRVSGGRAAQVRSGWLLNTGSTVLDAAGR
jgi:hypothetical protein